MEQISTVRKFCKEKVSSIEKVCYYQPLLSNEDLGRGNNQEKKNKKSIEIVMQIAKMIYGNKMFEVDEVNRCRIHY